MFLKSNKKIVIKKIFRIVVIAICGAVLGFNIYNANASSLVGNKLPMPFGYGAAVVLSGSMEPEMSKGDLIFVKETNNFEENQVVVFQDNNSLVVHRIIKIDNDTIITKGDANNVEDEPININRLKGEVIFCIPYVGTVIEFIRTPLGTILILALVILLMEIPRYKEKKQDTIEIDKIKEEIERLKNEAVQNSDGGDNS